jgi:glutamate N-acetyltransferase/amino-acid N-acetyltransferase
MITLNKTSKQSLKFEPVPVNGFLYGGIHCGIKANSSTLDLALIHCPEAVASAGVFTQNITKAAPVTVSQLHLSEGIPKTILINSGNANACTGEQGLMDANQSADLVASHLGLAKSEVLISSTGIIGVPMPMDAMKTGIGTICASLKSESIDKAADAIMTTDTYSKSVSLTVEIDGSEILISGIAKGSGMIHPNMATMLGFVMTDASVSSELLETCLKEATTKSFNMISVDGDTSTNDMVIAMASGAAQSKPIINDQSILQFKDAMVTVCTELAKLIASDGEGATKLLEMCVSGARSYNDAALAAKSVISSSLVKSAFFGNDANWGRIICAMGYSGAQFDPQNVALEIESEKGKIELMSAGAPLPFDENHALEVLSSGVVKISATLEEGDHDATAWGCDLTYEYVKINGEYRS